MFFIVKVFLATLLGCVKILGAEIKVSKQEHTTPRKMHAMTKCSAELKESLQRK